MSNELDDLFNVIGQTIWVVFGKEISQDPEENDKLIKPFNKIPIQAIISDLGASSTSFKMPGLGAIQSKDLLIDNKYKNMIENSVKFIIENNEYYGYKDNDSRLQIRNEGNYCRIYVYRKG